MTWINLGMQGFQYCTAKRKKKNKQQHLNAWVKPQMQDQQNVSNQQFLFSLTFSADKEPFNY